MDSCLVAAEAIVEKFYNIWKTSPTGTEIELEARLGKFDKDFPFSPGIHLLYFNDAVKRFDKCTEWTKVEDWREEIDVILDGNIRSRIYFDGCKMCKQTIIKKKLFSNFFICTGRRAATNAACGMDIRVCVSSEEKVDTLTLPPFCQTQFVRKKQRKSYYFRHWRFDVSRVWEGKSRLQVDDAQQNMTPKYEIEMELIDPGPYFENKSVTHIAKSMLMKLWNVVHAIASDESLMYMVYNFA